MAFASPAYLKPAPSHCAAPDPVEQLAVGALIEGRRVVGAPHHAVGAELLDRPAHDLLRLDPRVLLVAPEEERQWTAEVDFIDAVREGRPSVEPSFWDGLKYMEMTEAIFRSIETGQSVTMPLT